MPNPSPGQLVQVRTRRYLVEEVIPGISLEDSTLVHLACVDDDNQGQELSVLWECEVDAKILGGENWKGLGAKGFDSSNLFSAYYHTLKWNCVSAADPKIFHSPFRAGIQINAYQLEPLRKALLLPRVNLFIADDVGLGKTIEAGLIVREMLLRKKVRFIIVACPPSVLPQWQEEMELRFGLGFEIMDRAFLARIRQERGYAINPWSTHTRFIVSHALLRDEVYMATLRDHLGALSPQSLLILDEAHHAAPSSGSKYAIDSQFTLAIREVTNRFEHRLFLSATPHNGHSNSFSALLELLDPQRFCRGVPATKAALEQVMIRRLKEDLRTLEGGFPKRNIHKILLEVEPTQAPELQIAALLAEYATTMEGRITGEAKRQRSASALVISHLQQRLFSSIDAFARTLGVHIRTLKKRGLLTEWDNTVIPEDVELESISSFSGVGLPDQINPNEIAEEENSEDTIDSDQQNLIAVAQASAKLNTTELRSLPNREIELLKRMLSLAEANRYVPDARIKSLLKWMQVNLCPGIRIPGEPRPVGADLHWKPARVVLFTEYTHTLKWLKALLEEAIEGTDGAEYRIDTFTGETDRKTREAVKYAFNTDPTKHPLRILLANDAAREGVNLQNHCNQLFHLDLPWNPARLEQRNGRIDRKMQRAPEVDCHYFVYRHRPEDRVLEALVRKSDIIRRELGSLASVLENRLGQMVAGGIRRSEVDSLEKSITGSKEDLELRKVADEELEANRESTRKLQEQIDKLRDYLKRSSEEIGFDESAFRQALDQALYLYQAASMTPVTLPHGVQGYMIPRMDEQKGADPTWAATLDSLRPPQRDVVKAWKPREIAAPRPVVFSDPGTLDDEAVHLHLEHRVVQRLLGRFNAQGFLYHDLSRACLAQSQDSIPRVALLGRLCLYGAGSVRLHEELLAVTARWTPPDQRREGLKPHGEKGEDLTMRLLEKSLLNHTHRELPEAIRRNLAGSMPKDVVDLLPHLEARGKVLSKLAEEKLSERGQKEGESMRTLLETQQQNIKKIVKGFGDLQLDIFIPEERRQRENENRHQQKRLIALTDELRTEPTRIEQSYAVRVTRLEPIGIAYLWPVTG